MDTNQTKTKKVSTTSLEKYSYLLYSHADGNINNLKEYAEKLNISIETFLQLVTNYIIKNKNNPGYIQILDKLLKLPEERSNLFLKHCNFNIEHMENRFIKYILEYRPILLLDENKKALLRSRLYEYKKFVLNQEEKKHNPLVPDLNENQLNLAISFISSKYSLERFCLLNRISMEIIKKLESPLRAHHKKLYHDYLRKLKTIDELKEETINNDVLKLLELVKSLDNNFTTIDYFRNTIFGIKEILKAADGILNPDDNKTLRKKISIIKEVKAFSEKSIEGIFSEKTILKINDELINISAEVKLQVIEFLQENEIPISNITLKDANIITTLYLILKKKNILNLN